MLLGITLIAFFIMKAAPGDPVSMYMDPSISRVDQQIIRQNLGLDQPLVVQYVIWLKNIFKGQLGYSYVTGKPVFTMLIERLPATLLLSISSLVLVLVITFPLGLISGYKKESWLDDAVTFFSFVYCNTIIT